MTLLIVSDAIHESRLTDVMKRLLPSMEALPASFTRPCIIAGLPPTLSLRVDPTDGLLGLHHAIYSGLPEEEVHLHYRPAYWQPHLKLSNFRGDRRTGDTLVATLAQEWRPTSGMLDRFELIQYMPVQSIWQAPLRSVSSGAAPPGPRLSGHGGSL